MNIRRKLNAEERELIVGMLRHAGRLDLRQNLEEREVVSMGDGGMGSVQFLDAISMRQSELVRASATDIDGVTLEIALNINCEKLISELDIWKVDFSRIIKIPSPDNLCFE